MPGLGPAGPVRSLAVDSNRRYVVSAAVSYHSIKEITLQSRLGTPARITSLRVAHAIVKERAALRMQLAT